MESSLTSAKIRADHLDRQVLIYVRQSTFMQVRHNTGSTARQYDLRQRALELGWSTAQIVIIDQDQGRSGASTAGREGFQFLVAEVGLGHAGAVFSLEASRLARSSSDWYRLIEICALTNTLVVDEEGVYDPGQYNDRLLLGFKGTMSEAELHWLRQRLLGGKLEKAQKGQLRFRPPTGLVYDAIGQLVLDPDQQVQQAVQLVFDLFDELSSALAVVKHFSEHQLLFPTRLLGGLQHGELVWHPLRHGRTLAMLHNPLMRALTSMAEPKPEPTFCRVKNLSSRVSNARSNAKIGPLSYMRLIPATSLGTSFYVTNNALMIIGPIILRSVAAWFGREPPCYKAWSYVGAVVAG